MSDELIGSLVGCWYGVWRSGIGLGVGTVDQLCANIKKNKKALTRWTRTQVLIVDESESLYGNMTYGEKGMLILRLGR